MNRSDVVEFKYRRTRAREEKERLDRRRRARRVGQFK
jgi:hypothetical protein